MEKLTFEDVWRMFQETDKKFQETDKKFQETDKQMKETDKKIQETSEQMKETDKKIQETSEQMKETDKRLQETDRLIKELSRKWGNTSENIGFSAEKYFQTALDKTLSFGGIQFDDMMPNVRRKRRGDSCEFDIMLVNHNAVAIIEVKHRVPKTLPEIMVNEKAQEFRTFFNEYKNYALYLGVAGMSVEEEALKEAAKYGVGVMTQTGDAVECANIPLHAY